jgi:hypothetical protein
MAGVLMASLIGLMAAGSFLSNQYLVMVWGTLGIIAGLLKVASGRARGPRLPPLKLQARRHTPAASFGNHITTSDHPVRARGP